MMETMKRTLSTEVTEATSTNRVVAETLKRHLTQTEAARRAGISFRHWCRIVRNEVPPTILAAGRIAAVLNLPLWKLFCVHVRTRKVRD